MLLGVDPGTRKCGYAVVERIDAGDHIAHVIEITATDRAHVAARQLGSQAVHDIQPGHQP